MDEKECFVCKKKLKLVKQITNKCKCKYIFCDQHKLNHNCTFDFIKTEHELLKSKNPVIVSDKVQKI